MSQELMKLVQEMTMKKSPEEALNVVIREYLEKKVAECTAEIQRYEKKYGLNFEEFRAKLNDRDFEKKMEEKYGEARLHMDYIEWEGFTDSLTYLEQKISEL